MSLKDRLMEDLKVAMRNKDSVKKNAIRMVRAAVLQKEKDNRISLDDDGVTEVVAKELKKRRDVLPQYMQSGRQELVDELEREIEILKGYLPVQLSEEELEELVSEAISSTGTESIKDIGKVMKEVMPKVKGRADGRTVNAIAGRILGLKK